MAPVCPNANIEFVGKDNFEEEYTIELSDLETNFLIVQLPEIAATKEESCEAIYET